MAVVPSIRLRIIAKSHINGTAGLERRFFKCGKNLSVDLIQ
jgi:hypothetical protein